jgi:RNA-directed DNA polymerase
MMHGHGKSHSLIVLTKLPNKAASAAAEAVEERGLAKGKTLERNGSRTQSRKHTCSALERIR